MKTAAEPMYEVNAYVLHPRKPDWGPGKVLAVDGAKVTVYFRDCPSPAVKTIDTSRVPLDRATITGDPLLDNLPPWDPKNPESLSHRTTLGEGIAWFLDPCIEIAGLRGIDSRDGSGD